MFESENGFVVFVVKYDVETELLDLVDEFLVVVALERDECVFDLVNEFRFLAFGRGTSRVYDTLKLSFFVPQSLVVSQERI